MKKIKDFGMLNHSTEENHVFRRYSVNFDLQQDANIFLKPPRMQNQFKWLSNKKRRKKKALYLVSHSNSAPGRDKCE